MSAPAKVALVTGGTSGIGRAVAHALKRDGFAVAAVGRRADRLAALAREGFLVRAADMRKAAEIAGLFAWLADTAGRLDLLVNAAGIVRREAIEETGDDAIDDQIAANLAGTIRACRAAVAPLAASKGTIVNISSMLASRPQPMASVYAATKGGVESFSRALALELAPLGVRVLCVAPALVRSEIYTAAGMAPDAFEQVLAARGRVYPLGRAGEPEDIAGVVAFLASPAAAWMTGEIVHVDGGSGLGEVKR